MELRLVLHCDCGNVSIGCKGSARPGRFHVFSQLREMICPRIDRINVWANEPFAYSVDRVRYGNRWVNDFGVVQQTNYTDSYDPWDSNPFRAIDQILPPSLGSRVVSGPRVLGVNQGIDVWDDHPASESKNSSTSISSFS